MDLLVKAYEKPVIVMSVVFLILIGGLISVYSLPVTLFPEVERPSMVVNTQWRAASPAEVEAELIEPQEQVLKGIPGLDELTATAYSGSSSIKLLFKLGTDMDKALVEVLGRLSRVRKKPVDALPPVIDTSSPSDSLVFMFVQYLGKDGRNIDEFEDQIKTHVIPYLEDIEGVSTSELYISSDRQIEIKVDPYLLGQQGLLLSDVIAKVGRMKNFSGGFVPVGSKHFSLRYQGQQAIADIGNIVIKEKSGHFVRLSDIADVFETRGPKRHFVLQNGNSAVGIKLMRAKGASVLTALARVNHKLVDINAALSGKNLKVDLSFDPSVFIVRAITFVTSSLFLGILLAVAVLFYFIRDYRLCLLIALTIPISFIANFLILKVMGRSLNVISLAGLAFSSGLILDSGIVLLESVQNRLQKNKSLYEAVLEGTLSVKNALIASTITTLIIFIPVFTLEDVEGQLFADLAIAIIICVCTSLLLSLTLLPILCRSVLKGYESIQTNISGKLDGLVQNLLIITSERKNQIRIVSFLFLGSLFSVILLIPTVDYMPAVKRDALDTILQFPAASNVEYIEENIAKPISEKLKPYLNREKQPHLKNYYVVSSPGYSALAVRTRDPEKLEDFKSILEQEVLQDLPGTTHFIMQGSLFGGFNSTRSLALNVYAENYNRLVSSANIVSEKIKNFGEGYNVVLTPSPKDVVMEYRITPNLERIGEVGLSLSDMGEIVQSLGDGVYVGEQFDGKENINLIIKIRVESAVEQLGQLPIHTEASGIIPLGQLIEINEVYVPEQIQRIDQAKSITITVYPPESVSLTELADSINDMSARMNGNLEFGEGVTIRLSANSDKLNKALMTLSKAFALALIALLIVLIILFSNILDAILVMAILPFACVGGVWALAFANIFTTVNLDLLTFMGFIILLGLVVNNSILLVDHCRAAQRIGMGLYSAVSDALKTRIRPILLTSITSVLGMLPLAIIPGTGSEIYRGLAIVIAGGMAVSTIFSIVLLPCLLKLFSSADKNITGPVLCQQEI